MSHLATKTLEIIPGYTILERIGAGGYGEVWKASAPGGLVKAIKCVYGHLDEERAACELKALSRIKEVRHPFLLSLERIEVVDSQLVIVTELADASLKDRCADCRAAGQPGIPREELLAHLHDAADALDYMSERFSLQHLDIKPENLLIVGGRVKVADFGLVKDVQDATVSLLGGLTPLYAAPEVFLGHPSLHSDQYSLAIVYHELLTGALPFPGRHPGQLAAQHQQISPRLTSLPPDDRAAVARALAKKPHDRFPSCREFIECLLGRAGRQGGSAHRSASANPRDGQPARDTASTAALMQTATAMPPAAAVPPEGAADRTLPIREFSASAEALWAADSAAPRAGDGQAAAGAAENPESPWQESPDLDEDLLAQRAGLPRDNDAADWPVLLPQTDLHTEDLPPLEATTASAPLRPTLIVGIGGVAAHALQELGGRWCERFGPSARPAALRMLLIDTDPQTIAAASRDDRPGRLPDDETLAMPLRRAADYRDAWERHLRWISRRWLCNVPRSLRTEGVRPLGRLALVDHAQDLLPKLRTAIAAMTSPAALTGLAQATGTTVDPAPRIVLVASICGGTGSGMILDLAYAARKALADHSPAGGSVSGLLVHSTRRNPNERLLATANAWACLRELRRYACGGGYPGDDDFGLPSFAPEAPPFDDTAIVHLGDGLETAEFERGADSLADYLDLVTATAGGVWADQRSVAENVLAAPTTTELAVRTVGWCALENPFAYPAEADRASIRFEDVFERAMPKIDACGGARRWLLLCPHPDVGRSWRERLPDEVRELVTVVADPRGRTLLYCAQQGMPLSYVAARLVEGHPEHAWIATRLRTRLDITW